MQLLAVEMRIVGILLTLLPVWGQVTEYTATFGTFSSVKNGPSYGNNLNMTWIIKTNLPGKSISILFTEFDIEDSFEPDYGACVYDYLKITTEDVKLSLCGKSETTYSSSAPLLNRPIIINTNRVNVNFVTDYSNALPLPTGFKAHYTITDTDTCKLRKDKRSLMIDGWEKYLLCSQNCTNIPPTQYACSCETGFTLHANKHTCIGYRLTILTDNCGAKVFTDVTGVIKPTLFNGKYAQLTNCEWTIKGGIGDNIEIKFDLELFEIERHLHEGCVYDWVEYETKSGKVKRFCGNKAPNNGSWIKTFSPIVKVRFVTDLSWEGSGFQLYYRLQELDISCPKLDAPLHGSMTPPVVENPKYRDQVTFSCNEGYPMAGVSLLTCGISGQWNTLPPICQVDRCNPPHHLEDLPNGRIHPPITSFEVGVGIVHTVCNDGYELVEGSQIWLCGEDSKWIPKGNFVPTSDNVPKCAPAKGKCFYPSHLSNMQNGVIKPMITGTIFDQGTVVRTVCNIWHELVEGSQVWLCSEGHWLPKETNIETGDNVPKCEPISGLKGNLGVLEGIFDGSQDQIPRDIKEGIGSLISGGEPAKIGEWPWMAFIDIDNKGVGYTGDMKACGGSLIHINVVLTAAHCFKFEGDKNAAHYESKSKVFLGVHSRGNMTNIQTFSIKKLIRHENFSRDTFIADIAIIILNQNAVINKWVRPIRLPICIKQQQLPKRGMKGEEGYEPKGVIAGWGSDNEDQTRIKMILQYAEIPMMKRSQCSFFYKVYNPHNQINIVETMLCGGNREETQDACRGDSGGPFMYRDMENSRWYVNGIVSFGSQVACGKGYFGIYTKVSSYIPWIKTKLENEGHTILAKPKSCS